MSWKNELWPEWEIVSSIGSGAYGTVYKIKRQDIGGTYYSALKVISFTNNRRQLELISQEFAAMERLKGNTNIVSYEDHKIVPHKDGNGWDVMIRMELLTSLPDYLETHLINEKEVCKLGIDICNALILCEREKIIHRDIKPGNIFVSDYGDYKLGDFSLVKNIENHTEDTSPKGTYAYMAPEVYKGKRYDSTIDIYSLGLILYRLMNRGRGPFQPLPPEIMSFEVSEMTNIRRINSEVLPKPVDASPIMSSIILKACSVNPEKRYRSAAELQKALKRCSSSQTALNATRQVSYYIKKAANALYDSYEDIVSCVEEDISECNNEWYETAVDQEPTAHDARGGSGKTMSDYFTSAGDL